LWFPEIYRYFLIFQGIELFELLLYSAAVEGTINPKLFYYFLHPITVNKISSAYEIKAVDG
jgi:hypothetical protein